MAPFIVYGLPRSRTHWLSKFLTYGEWVCGHDELRHARSLDDVKTWFSQPYSGTAETAAAPWWRLVQSYCPDIRTVVVRRPVSEVVDSLMRLGCGFDRTALTDGLTKLDHKLDQIERRVPGALSVRFADLADEGACRAVFERCLSKPHDPAWWSAMAPINLQVNMAPIIRHYQAFRPRLEKVARQAKQHIIADMSALAKRDLDGVTLQIEPFGVFYEDARRLFEEHMVQTDQDVEDYSRKNLPLLQRLDDIGYLQVTTARSNGRMFGYLMAVLSPSLDSPDVTSAMHLAFFADKSFPGLGMKLQRASVEGLRKRGVGELMLRSGVRGSGPKLDAIYRRLGAEDFGHLYKLDFQGA